jgi:hypothetical protein
MNSTWHWPRLTDGVPLCGSLPPGDARTTVMAYVTCPACQQALGMTTAVPFVPPSTRQLLSLDLDPVLVRAATTQEWSSMEQGCRADQFTPLEQLGCLILRALEVQEPGGTPCT